LRIGVQELRKAQWWAPLYLSHIQPLVDPSRQKLSKVTINQSQHASLDVAVVHGLAQFRTGPVCHIWRSLLPSCLSFAYNGSQEPSRKRSQHVQALQQPHTVFDEPQPTIVTSFRRDLQSKTNLPSQVGGFFVSSVDHDSRTLYRKLEFLQKSGFMGKWM
jgi:hypothetical protein